MPGYRALDGLCRCGKHLRGGRYELVPLAAHMATILRTLRQYRAARAEIIIDAEAQESPVLRGIPRHDVISSNGLTLESGSPELREGLRPPGGADSP